MKSVLIALLSLFPLNAGAGDYYSAVNEINRLRLEGKTASAARKAYALYKSDKSEKNFILFASLCDSRQKALLEILKSLSDDYLAAGKDFAGNFGLCVYLRETGEEFSAEAFCKKALFLSPLKPGIYRELGLLYSREGKPRKAADNFTRYAMMNPQDYEGHLLLAKTLEKTGRKSAALASYRKALSRIPPKMRRSRTATAVKKAIRGLSSGKKEKIPDEESCFDGAESLLKKYRPEKAMAEIRKCSPHFPDSVKLALLRSEILVALGKYEKAVKEYAKTAKMKKASPETKAFCFYKMGDTYAKLSEKENALKSYLKSEKINPKDTNMLRSFAIFLERSGEKKEALKRYYALLVLEPNNEKLSRKINRLEIETLSDREILDELKARGAAPRTASRLTPTQKQTFRFMRMADENRPAEFLKKKAFYLPANTVKIEKRGRTRILLNYKGFLAYRKVFSQEIIKFLSSKGIAMGQVFKIRDRKGDPFFDKNGMMTMEGYAAYLKAAATGEKTWLMPYERVSSENADREFAARYGEFIKKGYRRIYEPEFLWLLKATDCPEEVLMPPRETYLQKLKTAKGVYYFLCYEPNSTCSPIGDSKTLLFNHYIKRYRNGDDSIPEFRRSTAFFGTGSVESSRFCKDGKIWMGD